MKVLFCGGSERSGSWQMRGVQIAQGGGWDAISSPSLEQVKAADIIVAVKRMKGNLADMLRGSGKPIVWDALDFWKQPEESTTDNLEDAKALAAPHIERLAPALIIGANKQMADDLGGACIYHHARLDAVRGAGKEITYDGHARYIEGLHVPFAKVGWTFKAGQPSKETGAILSARCGADGGWLARRWKSNVKAANAIACGVPFISEPDQAYLETVPSEMALWFETQEELNGKIEQLVTPSFLQGAKDAALQVSNTTTLAYAVNQYREVFKSL